MGVALSLAQRGLGTTAPNPSVGAVIVDPARDIVVARGWTQPGGRPHAEVEALARAGAAARGATLYVTLEPCAHQGRTPPCADAVIAAGIARAVVGIEDPDPRVAGRGIARMVAAGITVDRFVRVEEADWVTRGHILRVTERRPLVQVKLALDAAGNVPHGAAGQPVWVTGDSARRMGHLLRAEADAILVGRGTVEDDDPALTCRLPGAADRSPVRVVLSATGAMPAGCRLLATARDVPLWVVVAGDAPEHQRRALAAAGAVVIAARRVEGALWLPDVLESLVARGITRLLVEGGPAVWRAFDRAGLVDEVALFHGGGAAAAPADTATLVRRHLPAFQGNVSDWRVLGQDRMTVLRRPAARRRGETY
ncbi:MAG: bifunctional diaminohydroxyphosphoribosylaminopyrimidine deaminase/5-amino-6-(5-phosphoribosylamino)uracil reductase RibD [Hyphomicrobiaceae bacterium]